MTARLGPRAVGALLLVASATSFGCLAIFAELVYASGVDPISALFLRFAIAAAVMVVLLVLRGGSWPRGRLLAGLVVMGGVGYVGQSFSYFTALTYAPAGLVAMLLYLYPVIVTLLAAAVLRERLTAIKIGALTVAIAGCALTIGPSLDSEPLGVILGVSAAIIYSVYILVGSRLTPQAGALASSTVVMVAATMVYGVAVSVRGLALPETVLGWGAVLGLAVVSTVIAIVTFFAGMERLGPTDASTVSTLEPVVTVVLAALVLGDVLAPLQVAGGALILAAVIVLVRAGGTSTPRAAVER